MSNTSVFFPQTALDILIQLEHVDLDGDELVMARGGYRYKVIEAVRILREVTSGEDPRDLCGRVRAREQLTEELGAELLGGSMLVEDSAYDIVNGFLGAPTDSGDGDAALADDGRESEEELLLALASIEELQ